MLPIAAVDSETGVSCLGGDGDRRGGDNDRVGDDCRERHWGGVYLGVCLNDT